MSLKAPQAGGIQILASKRGRNLHTRPFTYPGGRVEEFVMWGYEKGSSALVFALTEDCEVLALRQFRHGANSFVLEVPGGLPNKGESPKDTARRELLEETGYDVGTMLDLRVRPFVLAPHHDYRFTPFLALGCRKVAEPKPDSCEIMETALIPVAEWYRKVWAGEVIDNQMIGISLLALPHIADIKFL